MPGSQKPLDHHDFMVTQVQLVTLAGLLARLPLAAFVAACDRAECLGPLLDPTLYQQKGQDLARLGDLAQAALKFTRELARLGFSVPGFSVSATPSDADIDATLRALAGEER